MFEQQICVRAFRASSFSNKARKSSKLDISTMHIIIKCTSRSLPSGSRPSLAQRWGCQVAMVGVTGSWTNQSYPGDEYLPFEPSSSPLGHSKVAQRERGGSCTDLFILAQSCWVDRWIALCALQSSAHQRKGERERMDLWVWNASSAYF